LLVFEIIFKCFVEFGSLEGVKCRMCNKANRNRWFPLCPSSPT